jgi:aminoglycoside phosphotransferase (APT) family kinase protein|tara:strand:+ start:89 stop:1027 length:939 start_codon:yes stop_codon:yes gene_type:complete
MEKRIVEKIFSEHGLGKVESVANIEIGFTNKVYLVNDAFILKVCEDESNEQKFEIEVFFYNFFKDKIPVPKIRVFDKSKSIYGKFFMIYPKIDGDNLYAKWHLLNNNQRKIIIKQLCDILKVINKSPFDQFLQKFDVTFSDNWHDKILNQIQNSLKKIEKKKLLSSEFIKIIKKFVDDNHNVLKEQKLALVYWDAHFDNLLVQETKIVGILDFERTEVSSIDFVLDIVKRMVEYPKKYMSEKFEKFAKKKDYAHLLDWFQEFYPELFEFKNLDKRLDLYAVEHDLDTLIWYPNSREVKQMIAKTVKYDSPTF